MTEKTGLWMYCIIENKGEMQWDCLGIHGTSPVRVVSNGKFAAVVSEEPVKKYPLVRDYLMAHQRVNEVVMQTHQVLPVRFGTMTDSEEKIINEVLLPKRDEFRALMAEISGKEECGLRVRWKDLDKVFREIGETDEKIIEKKRAILSLPESQRRTEMIDIGHLVQSAVQERNASMARTLMARLSPLAVEAKENKTLGDAMVLNAAFLVEKEKQEAFDEVVDRFDADYGTDLQFKYVGPVPPFNFVEIVIKWEEEPFSKKEEAHVSAR